MKYIGTYVLMIMLIGLSLMLFNTNLGVDLRSLHRQIVHFRFILELSRPHKARITQ
jgi:hypothetical protein